MGQFWLVTLKSSHMDHLAGLLNDLGLDLQEVPCKKPSCSFKGTKLPSFTQPFSTRPSTPLHLFRLTDCQKLKQSSFSCWCQYCCRKPLDVSHSSCWQRRSQGSRERALSSEGKRFGLRKINCSWSYTSGWWWLFSTRMEQVNEQIHLRWDAADGMVLLKHLGHDIWSTTNAGLSLGLDFVCTTTTGWGRDPVILDYAKNGINAEKR